MAYEIVVLTNMAIAVLFALSLNVITGFVVRLVWAMLLFSE